MNADWWDYKLILKILPIPKICVPAEN